MSRTNEVSYTLSSSSFLLVVDPISVDYWDVPDDLQTGESIIASVYFTRALMGSETFGAGDIRVDGIDGATVSSVTVDMNNPKKYNITVLIPVGADGVLSLSIDAD